MIFRPQIQEAAARVWVTYYENERKCTYSNTERLQNQLQSKLQKVGHGVTGVLRLASRASRQKKDVVVKASPASLQVCCLNSECLFTQLNSNFIDYLQHTI